MSNQGQRSVFTCIGATSHSIRERERNDYYSTDPLAIQLLDKHGLLDKEVPYWETACGNGRLAMELKRLGYDVVKETDLFDRGYGDVGVDFFKCSEVFEGNLITNPPYKHINNWIQHSIDLASNKSYIFCRIQTIESLKRWHIFKNNPPILICPFVQRVKCYKNDDLSYKSSAVCYSWFIWDNTVDNEETKVKWLI